MSPPVHWACLVQSSGGCSSRGTWQHCTPAMAPPGRHLAQQPSGNCSVHRQITGRSSHCVCMLVCMCVRLCMCENVHTCVCVCVCVCVCACMCLYMFMCVFIYICVCWCAWCLRNVPGAPPIMHTLAQNWNWITHQYILQCSCSCSAMVGGVGCSPSPTPSCCNWYTKHCTDKRRREEINGEADLGLLLVCNHSGSVPLVVQESTMTSSSL